MIQKLGLVNCHLNESWLTKNGYKQWLDEIIDKFDKKPHVKFERACDNFRKICGEISKLINNTDFKGAIDDMPVFYHNSKYKTEKGMRLAIALNSCAEMCEYEAINAGIELSEWWYRCWNIPIGTKKFYRIEIDSTDYVLSGYTNEQFYNTINCEVYDEELEDPIGTPLCFFENKQEIQDGVILSDNVLSGTVSEPSSGTFTVLTKYKTAEPINVSFRYEFKEAFYGIKIDQTTYNLSGYANNFFSLQFLGTVFNKDSNEEICLPFYSFKDEAPSGFSIGDNVLYGRLDNVSSGQFIITATYKNADPIDLIINYNFKEEIRKISMNSTSNNISGYVNENFTFQLNGTVYNDETKDDIGTPIYTAKDTLPNGIVLNGSILTGSPSITGSGSFIITATYEKADPVDIIFNYNFKERSYRISIDKTIHNITGYTNEYFAFQLNGTVYDNDTEANMGNPTYSVKSGKPSALTLNGSVIFGTFSNELNGSFIITASYKNTDPIDIIFYYDFTNKPIIKSYKITMSSTTNSLSGYINNSFTFKLNGSVYEENYGEDCGEPIYSFKGSRPSGISLNGNTISGIFTSASSGSFIITASYETADPVEIVFKYNFKEKSYRIVVDNNVKNLNGYINETATVKLSGTVYDNDTGLKVGTPTFSAKTSIPSGISLSGTTISGTLSSVKMGSFIITASYKTATPIDIVVYYDFKQDPSGRIGTLDSLLGKPISSFTSSDLGKIIKIPYTDPSGKIGRTSDGCIEFQIVGVNHHKDVNHPNEPTITLMTRKCIRRAPFDAIEATHPNIWVKNVGNERWSVSNIRQWLNSSSTNWYSAQHKYDTPPTIGNCYNYNSRLNNIFLIMNDRGFLSGFSDTIKSHLATTKIITALNSYEKNISGVSYDKTNDKVFLPSITELFGSRNQSILEGSKMAYFSGDSMRRRAAGPSYSGVGSGYYRTRSIYQRGTYTGSRWEGPTYRVGPSGTTDSIGANPRAGAFEIAPMIVLY